MPKISVIMPVYNAENFVEDSINSVLNQTFSDFELICINHSSTDNSLTILNRLAEKDKRIKVYTVENTYHSGNGQALNLGISKAIGDFLCFIDDDDLYKPEYLEKMFNAILKSDLDLCICRASYLYSDNKEQLIKYHKLKVEKDSTINVSKINRKKQFKNAYFPQWLKIIRKTFYEENKISFPEKDIKLTDVATHYQLIFLNNKIGFVDESIYYHRVHNKQITKDLNNLGAHDFILTYDFLSDWSKCNEKINVKIFKQWIKYLLIVANRNKFYRNTKEELVKRIKNYNWLDRLFVYFKQTKKLHTLQSINIANVGKYSYCVKQPFVANPKETVIGNFVSIGENVRIGCGEHPLNFLSTSPYFYFDNLGFKNIYTSSHNEYQYYKPVIIGSDVWIGDNVFIKNGVKIGNGSVIGACSVVTKDVLPYSIVGGNPAQIIRFRFEKDVINNLLVSEWWTLPDYVLKNISYDDIQTTLEYIAHKKND